MRWGRSVLAASALSTLALACELILGLDDDHFSTREAPDAAIPDPCAHAAPPPPPDAADSRDREPMLFGIDAIDMSGRRPTGEPVGFDLDGVCTCDTRRGSAHGGAPSCVPRDDAAASACDADGGIDNAAMADDLFSAFAGQFNDAFNHGSECGSQTMLIQLSNYNGEADDPLVVVALAPSYGIRDPHPGVEDFDAGRRCYPPEFTFPDGFPEGGPYPAKRDGTDRWSLPPSYLQGTGVLRDRFSGYVANHQLVVKLEASGNTTAGWSVVIGGQVAPFTTTILSAHLERTSATTFRIDHGTLTSRASVDDLISGVGALRIPAPVGPAPYTFVCASDLYPPLKQILCSVADITTLRGRDFQGDTCNAVSLVMQFTASPVGLGSPAEAEQKPAEGCGAGFRDSCSVP